MKCANCENQAIYLVENKGANSIYYCAKCLPLRLHATAMAGHYDIPAPIVEEPVKKTTTRKKKTDEN